MEAHEAIIEEEVYLVQLGWGKSTLSTWWLCGSVQEKSAKKEKEMGLFPRILHWSTPTCLAPDSISQSGGKRCERCALVELAKAFGWVPHGFLWEVLDFLVKWAKAHFKNIQMCIVIAEFRMEGQWLPIDIMKKRTISPPASIREM